MKCYIASRMRNQNQVSNLIEELTNRGHNCTHDWTQGEKLKPYKENPDRSREIAKNQLESSEKLLQRID